MSLNGLYGNEALCCDVLMGMKPVIGQQSAILRHVKFRYNVQLSVIETCQFSIVTLIRFIKMVGIVSIHSPVTIGLCSLANSCFPLFTCSSDSSH